MGFGAVLFPESRRPSRYTVADEAGFSVYRCYRPNNEMIKLVLSRGVWLTMSLGILDHSVIVRNLVWIKRSNCSCVNGKYN